MPMLKLTVPQEKRMQETKERRLANRFGESVLQTGVEIMLQAHTGGTSKYMASLWWLGALKEKCKTWHWYYIYLFNCNIVLCVFLHTVQIIISWSVFLQCLSLLCGTGISAKSKVTDVFREHDLRNCPNMPWRNDTLHIKQYQNKICNLTESDIFTAVSTNHHQAPPAHHHPPWTMHAV